MAKLKKFMLHLIQQYKIIQFAVFSILITSCYQKEIQMEEQIVYASCGQCQFDMTENLGCDLAIKFEGKSYFVEGTSIDQHGDAHEENGFCNAVRTAKVKGFVKNDKFFVKSFKLID